MDKYISGEDYQKLRQQQRHLPPAPPEELPWYQTSLARIGGAIVVAIILVMGGWFGGAWYQSGQDASAALSNPSGPNGTVMCQPGGKCSGSGGDSVRCSSGGACPKPPAGAQQNDGGQPMTCPQSGGCSTAN